LEKYSTFKSSEVSQKYFCDIGYGKATRKRAIDDPCSLPPAKAGLEVTPRRPMSPGLRPVGAYAPEGTTEETSAKPLSFTHQGKLALKHR